MSKRDLRQRAIKDILREENVRTQQELTALLRERGFSCIQSTVSRDVAEMGLVKGADRCYALPTDILLRRVLADMLLTVQSAGNLVVIRTMGGGAAGVAGAIDEAGFEGVLGTVAGDDTIFVATRTPEDASALEANLKAYEK